MGAVESMIHGTCKRLSMVRENSSREDETQVYILEIHSPAYKNLDSASSANGCRPLTCAA